MKRIVIALTIGCCFTATAASLTQTTKKTSLASSSSPQHEQQQQHKHKLGFGAMVSGSSDDDHEGLSLENKKKKKSNSSSYFSSSSSSGRLGASNNKNRNKPNTSLDAELELEKDEHLLEHLQKSLVENIQTQERETLRIVQKKVDEQDIENLRDEELTEEDLGITHTHRDNDLIVVDDANNNNNNNNIEGDNGSDLGFKEDDLRKSKTTKPSSSSSSFEDSILTDISKELDEVIEDGKSSSSLTTSMQTAKTTTTKTAETENNNKDIPRAAAFASMDEDLKDVLDAVHTIDNDDKKVSTSSLKKRDRREETLGWTEADAANIDPQNILENAQSGVRALVLNPETVHDLKEKFEDMKSKGEVPVEGNWKKFDAEAKEEKKQQKEAKKMEKIAEESVKILDDIDAARMAQSLESGAGNKSFSWTFSYLYFPLIVFFSILLAVVALLIKLNEKNKLKRGGSFDRSFGHSSPGGKNRMSKSSSRSKLLSVEEEEIVREQQECNPYPDFADLRDIEKGNRIYKSSIESFEEYYDGDDVSSEEEDDDDDDFEGEYEARDKIIEGNNDIYARKEDRRKTTTRMTAGRQSLSEKSSDASSSFTGFREKAIAVAKKAEEFISSANNHHSKKPLMSSASSATFHRASSSKYGADDGGDSNRDVEEKSQQEVKGKPAKPRGESSFVKSATTKWI